MDGTIVTAQNATDYGYSIDLSNYGKLVLPPKNAGETYLVSFSDIFAPTNSTKLILNKYWNVTYNEFYEKKLDHNIEIAMTSASPLALKANSPNKIFATVSSGIPSYFAFLFRIALSGLAIILALKIIKVADIFRCRLVFGNFFHGPDNRGISACPHYAGYI